MDRHFRKIDIIIFALCLAVAIGMMLYLAIAWKTIPDKIPGKFTSSGEILSYESKAYLFSCPVALFFLVISLAVVSMFPTAWNIPTVKVTPENEPFIRVCIRNMMNIMLILITATMTGTFIFLVKGKATPVWLFLGLGVLFVVNTVFWIIRTIKVAKLHTKA